MRPSSTEGILSNTLKYAKINFQSTQKSFYIFSMIRSALPQQYSLILSRLPIIVFALLKNLCSSHHFYLNTISHLPFKFVETPFSLSFEINQTIYQIILFMRKIVSRFVTDNGLMSKVNVIIEADIYKRTISMLKETRLRTNSFINSYLMLQKLLIWKQV